MAMSSKLFQQLNGYNDINFGCPVKKVVCKGAELEFEDVDLMIRLTQSRY
jgi:hypothetical protein